MGKRHEHRKQDAQRAVGDSHYDTGISRVDPNKALPYSGGRILRVAKNGIGEAAYCFAVGEAEVFALANMEANRETLVPLLAKTYGRENAKKWWSRWRIFFMAYAELWGYRGGCEWLVWHYLLERSSHSPK